MFTVSNNKIMRDFSHDHDWLSINTATIRKSLGHEIGLSTILSDCARQGIRAVAPWRDQVQTFGLQNTARLIKSLELQVTGHVRGGLFTAVDKAGLDAAIEDNKRAIDEACEIGAKCLIFVAGSLPGALAGKALHKDLALARNQVHDGFVRLMDYAVSHKMPLAIEPLHPMYAADRSCINTLEQALDVCDLLDPSQSGAIGVAVDVYHTWWDSKLESQIKRAGETRILAYHVCDWLTPTTDMLNDRGMMGDGVIELKKIRGWVEETGFEGFAEVEIFSTNNWWQKDHLETLKTCIERHRNVV
jgi:sugar phosphate isomerase/epimerase